MEYELKEHSITVKRGDSPKIYKESQFWYELKKLLQKNGYDVIKKLMTKDGHMVSEGIYYLRSRKLKAQGATMIWDANYQIRFTCEPYNQNGEVTLSVEGADDETQPTKANPFDRQFRA